MSADTTGYATIPRWMLNDPRVDASMVLAYVALQSYSNEYASAFPYVSTMAKRAKMSESSTRRAIRRLEELGVVETAPQYRDDGGRRANRYYVKNHKPEPAPAAENQEFPDETAGEVITPPSHTDRGAPQSQRPGPPVTLTGQEEEPLEEEKEKKRSAQPTSIPDDWVPKIDVRPVAESLGLDHDFQLVEFRRWYRASGAVKADWDAQFEIWLRSPRTARTAKARAQKPAGAVALDFTPPPRRECQHLRVADSGYCESCGERVPDWQASAVRGLAEGGAF